MMQTLSRTSGISPNENNREVKRYRLCFCLFTSRIGLVAELRYHSVKHEAGFNRAKTCVEFSCRHSLKRALRPNRRPRKITTPPTTHQTLTSWPPWELCSHEEAHPPPLPLGSTGWMGVNFSFLFVCSPMLKPSSILIARGYVSRPRAST